MASKGIILGTVVLVLLFVNMFIYMKEFKRLPHAITHVKLLERYPSLANTTNVSSVLSLKNLTSVSKSIPVLQKGNESKQIRINPGFESFSSASHTVSNRRVMDINCEAILTGNIAEVKKADILSTRIRHHYDRNLYINITSNCSEFITKRGYIMDSMTKLEEEFPLAYSIIMYKDIVQSERLLRAIYRPQNYYCIHVDSKTPNAIYTGMTKIASCFKNVYVSEKRYNVIWGKISVVDPELQCMEILWNKSKTWKYFINLTGQEFPLLTNLQLVKTLKSLNGSNIITGNKNQKFADRWAMVLPAPHGIAVTKGAVHIAATRGYVDFALHDPKALDFYNWTSKTEIPDETFFSSLNYNTHLNVPGAHGDIDSNYSGYSIIRFKRWLVGRMQKTCHGKVLRKICIFGTGDLPLLASRKEELFANKFIFNFKRYGYDCLEELHFNRTLNEYINNVSLSGWFTQFLSDVKYIV